MREIRLSGSGEGAVLSRPYLIRRVRGPDGTRRRESRSAATRSRDMLPRTSVQSHGRACRANLLAEPGRWFVGSIKRARNGRERRNGSRPLSRPPSAAPMTSFTQKEPALVSE